MTKPAMLLFGAWLLFGSAASGGDGRCAGCYYPMPNMIGDFIALPDGLLNPINQFDYDAMVAQSGGAGRMKASRNNNILPQDRLFIDYSWSDAALFDAATDVRTHGLHQTIFGIEKSLMNGLCSLEVRLPMVDGYSSVQNAVIDQPAGLGSEFGNMYVGGKAVLLGDSESTLTAGIGLTLPTGNSTDYSVGGNTTAEIDNQAIYVKPYIAYSRKHGATFFQLWTELDVAAGGDDLSFGGTFRGTYQQQNLVSVDMQLGRWLFYNPSKAGWLQGIAPIVEMHYTSTMNDTDRVSIGQNYTNPFNQMDFWSVTMGTHMQVTNHSNLRLAASLPLHDGPRDETHSSDVTLFLQFDVVR
jgi:hypothetical protein